MPYVVNGKVVERRSLWRMSIFSDLFWGIINFIGLFFASIFSKPSDIKDNRKRQAGGGYGNSGGKPPGGGGGPKRMGRVDNRPCVSSGG